MSVSIFGDVLSQNYWGRVVQGTVRPGDGLSRGRFIQGAVSPGDGLSRGRFVLGTLRYKNLGDGLLRGWNVQGRNVRVPRLVKRVFSDVQGMFYVQN
jgi:hypothetical protein